MNELARQFLNRYQGGFPLEANPFAQVAEGLDTDVVTLLALIQGLLEDGILSRFGPLYDASSMGGGLTLAAISVPEERYDEIADLLNGIPEVAHNYQREHELNMWFVLATETPEAVQQTLDRIAAAVGLPVYNFPKLETFYLGLWINLDADGGVRTTPVPGPLPQSSMPIDDIDRRIICATQAGLPLQREPYFELAEACACSTNSLMQRLRQMLERGVIRRIGAVPNHYRLGLRGNGMSVWNVRDDRLQELGTRIGQLDFVSHCYARPRHLPLWPYNLFAMVHGHDRDEVRCKAASIEALLGPACKQHDVLFSSRILKKTGLRLVA